MVDFNKRIRINKIEKKIKPYEIYDTLDIASYKGPLIPAQETILDYWYNNYKEKKDVILKLHTGQGKTLIGLLILQSRINQGLGPAVYLCPNSYLVEQTCQQADSFGINYVTAKNRLPEEFTDGRCILITTAKKMFNGETKFGLGTKSLKVSTILMDDSHACINEIKDTCRIEIKKKRQVYHDILHLFGPELEKQGAGTYADIVNGDYDSFLPVPYWDWQDKSSEITRLLSQNRELDEIKFAWPILKNNLKECQCIISGNAIEIVPYIIPLSVFGSYYNAEHRIFMSATLSDDSFLIKRLGLDRETILTPLTYNKEKWSGEKMILIPSLIDESLDRKAMVNKLAKPEKDRKYGVVTLVPSFKGGKDWEGYGSVLANKDTINSELEKLKNKECEKALVIANRYDGIDLPDNSCRVLVIDSKPFAESLYDRYIEECRFNSDIIAVKIAQTIEQGIGRGVRGEKDYCAVLLIGAELVNFIRNKSTRDYFSNQTKMQIEIGLKIAGFAKEDLIAEDDPYIAVNNLVKQLLERDDGWKEYYTERMSLIDMKHTNDKILEIFESERIADLKYLQGDYAEATQVLQSIIDRYITKDEEKGWYIQEIARIMYTDSKSESNKMQLIAHNKNRYLLKPKEGMTVSKLPISLKRIENIIRWISEYEDFQELNINLENILSNIRFGVKADTFEKDIDELAKCLGFYSERPDKEWKEGPDNLWKVKDDQFILIECKSMVDINRKEINKDETGQMNNACAWFEKNYGDINVKRIMIIPTRKVSRAAGFNKEVEIMRERNLKKLVNNLREFYKEFKNLDLKDLSSVAIQRFINLHKLDVESLLKEYSEIPKIY
ncbi:MAG TPA: DEAD/DEAH box helicase [Clostridium sp.]|nr:DEAD/DEAH box helicase [Clostridium sp.]